MYIANKLAWVLSLWFCATVVFSQPPRVIAAPLAMAAASISVQQALWSRVDREWPDAHLAEVWSGPPLRDPRGITRLGNALYVTDPGLPTDSPRRPRIIKFPLVNGQPGAPVVFFERPGFLLSAKFSSPASGYNGGGDALVVADQGEELPNGTFTGRGAKILLLPILPDGQAGEPQVIREGAPYFCPSGILVVERLIYVSDPCAGPPIARPERPSDTFPSSLFFAQDFAGGPPRVLLSGHPFTSLIGISSIEYADHSYSLLVHDTDSGRLDPSGTGGRRNFAPPAAAEIWVFDILDTRQGTLSRPRRIGLTEDGPVKLAFASLAPGAIIVVRTLAGNAFVDATTRRMFTAGDLALDGSLTLTVASPVELGKVTLEVEVFDPTGQVRAAKKAIVLDKDPDQPTMLVDNKGGGRKKKNVATVAAAVQAPAQAQTADRTFNFSIDQVSGKTWFFPEAGGTPISIAKSAKPFAGMLSEDQNMMWITDRAGKLLVASVPDFATLETLFQYPSVKYCDANGSGAVDRTDIAAILSKLNQWVGPYHPMDMDGNGIVSIGDARACSLGCLRPLCKPEF